MTDPADERELRLRSAITALRGQEPFWGTLVLFARPTLASVVAGSANPTACTDGRRIYFNPSFLDELSGPELVAVLAHEVAHAANLHVQRRGERDAVTWNVAADIWVNGALAGARYHGREMRLPWQALRDPKLEGHSVEEIYELLQRQGLPRGASGVARDLLPGRRPPEAAGTSPEDQAAEAEPGEDTPDAGLREHWRRALQNATVTARLQGNLPAGTERLLEVAEGQLDWRSLLWRFVTPQRDDFQGHDRRFVHLGLYLDELRSEGLTLDACLDTSGSVSEHDLREFHGEVQGIQQAYPHLQLRLWHADTRLHGPHELDAGTPLPRPLGGGGTDFRPFFAATEDSPLRVYVTDGYGHFPAREPAGTTLWVVAPGGLQDERFPFGLVTRLY